MKSLSITEQEAHILIKDFKTPVYVFDIDRISDRYTDIQQAFKNRYMASEVSLSYKTCPLMGVLQHLQYLGAIPEVVSEFEFDMANTLGSQRKVINGPNKTDRVLQQAILNHDIINIDHQEEFGRINTLAQSVNKKVEVGVRLSLDQGWNRFGFACDTHVWKQLVQVQSAHQHIKIVGIHVHIGTAIRDVKTFYQAADQLQNALKEWPFEWAIQWLDLGGGLAGISPKWEQAEIEYPVPDVEDYANAWIQPLQSILDIHQPLLIMEPGRTLFEPFGGLLSQVVTCREQNSTTQSLVLNAGINAVPTARVYRHPLQCAQGSNEVEQVASKQTTLYGPLCMQSDTLATDTPLPTLNKGDWVFVKGIGAYNQSRSVPFIQPRPGVVGKLNGEFMWLRQHETLGDHLQLECW